MTSVAGATAARRAVSVIVPSYSTASGRYHAVEIGVVLVPLSGLGFELIFSPVRAAQPVVRPSFPTLLPSMILDVTVLPSPSMIGVVVSIQNPFLAGALTGENDLHYSCCCCCCCCYFRHC